MSDDPGGAKHNSEGVSCEGCGERTPNIAVCDRCIGFVEVLGIGGIDNPNSVYQPRLVLQFAPECYLCGSAPSEHADHVIPRASGGSDHWSNIGAACAHCNLAKHDRILTLSKDQRTRLAEQHQSLMAASGRVTDAIWWQWFESDIEGFFDDWAEDLDVVDDELVREEVADWFEEYPGVRSETIDAIVAYIVATAAVGGPTGPRATKPRNLINTWEHDE